MAVLVAHSRVLRVAIPLLSCYLVWMVSGGLPSLQITLTWSDVRHPWHESVKLVFCRCHPSELRKASGRLKVPEYGG